MDPAWQLAMKVEIDALHKTHTWVLVLWPPGVNLVNCKWVFKLKQHSDGSIEKHKALLVARGFTQYHGIDYHDTFHLVVKLSTVCLVLALVIFG